LKRIDKKTRFIPSVLDRLSEKKQGVPTSSLNELKKSVLLDLEDLFNTRQAATLLEEDHDLKNTLLAYGVPDFSGFNVKNDDDLYRLGRALETAIKLFEPRLQDVTVRLAPVNRDGQRVHFRVRARLRVNPAPEQVSFDTVLHLYNGRYEVGG
jgi:type VI secretion system protein ImpF